VKAATLALVALAVGFAAMYWWLFIRTTPPAGSGAHKPATQAPAPSPPVALPAPMTSAPAAIPGPARAQEIVKPPEPAKPEARKAEPPKAEPLKFEPKKAEPPKAEPAKAESAKPETLRVGTDGSMLKFRFKGESWVEIRDARGKVLLSRLNSAGSEAEVAGKPPFTVVVGNAPEVQVLYNDRPFDLEPHTKVAVARFTVQ
jgi:cytoskeleton protein RodZ